METLIQYEIWELDENSGLAKIEHHIQGSRNRVVLVKPLKIAQTHDTMIDAIKEIETKGFTYTEYTILPRIYKTN